MEKLEIYDLGSSIFNQKENGTKVNYFIFDEYEIHFNIIPPGTTQEWHMHREIEETLFILSGEISVKWKDDYMIRQETVPSNSVVRVKNSIHTIENQTDKEASFLVLRFVPDGTIKRELIKNDKIVIDTEPDMHELNAL